MDGMMYDNATTAPSERFQRLTMLVATVTAVAALGGSAAAGYALIYTGQSIQATRDQLTLVEQGQVTERYGRAVDQLGSSALDIRVGGIYALERLMRDSPPDQPTIIEVLSAFVREHSASRGAPKIPRSVTADRLLPAAPADVQAALTVIGRRDPNRDGNRMVNLSYAKLFGADLARANLAGVDLEGADLTGAVLFETNLTGTYLLSANLSWATLTKADLSKADLVSATMVNTYLYNANLNDAVLNHANLTDAFLGGATLQGADLRSANLSNVHNADLTGTKR